MFDELDKLQFLTAPTRRQLITQLVLFIYDEYGPQPSHAEAITVSQATIELFPFLKVDRSSIGGIVSTENTYKIPMNEYL